MNLGNQPVEILIEDVYLLVVPSPLSNVDPGEEEQRAQAAKAERLESAELLHMRGQPEVTPGNDICDFYTRVTADTNVQYRRFRTVEGPLVHINC